LILDGETAWQDAILAAAILSVAPQSLGGAQLKAYPGPVRTAWLDVFRDLLEPDTPWRVAPSHTNEARLLGGLDLASTLRLGRPVFESGLLAESDGGVLVMSMAERTHRAAISHICSALDQGSVIVERDGFSRRSDASFAVIAQDESIGEDEMLSAALSDRLGFPVNLRQTGIRDIESGPYQVEDIRRARRLWRQIPLVENAYRELAAVGMALAIDSLRPVIIAARAARIIAALNDHGKIETADLTLAARLVLLPRLNALPQKPDEEAVERSDDEVESQPEQQQAEAAPEDRQNQSETESSSDFDGALDESVVASAAALLPAGLLDSIDRQRKLRKGRSTEGKSGVARYAGLRGRPIGSFPGSLRGGSRLNLLATLRAAAPWQGVRRRELSELEVGDREQGAGRILVRGDDIRITRYKQRTESTVIFVVDASGSAALHRLAESKGAVELLLADCYVRRDRVALIAFRGQQAQLLLPPTRSLVRAKRSLSGLPGGGGTPLASGIDAATALAKDIQRQGGSPSVVILTDGRANICRDGSSGRQQAFDDALKSAAVFLQSNLRCMVVDTSVRPHHNGAELAHAMAGIYLPLPMADAATLSQAIIRQQNSATV
jgi:magnesium chelatase subunit D